MVELSPETSRRVQRMFDPDSQGHVERMLVEECADNLPQYENSGSHQLERIRFAVLKLSHGDLRELRKWIELAKLDWRDVLMNSGFADDIHAHLKWTP
jgi:hypothetical protein